MNPEHEGKPVAVPMYDSRASPAEYTFHLRDRYKAAVSLLETCILDKKKIAA
jgi:hypothetical protein